MEAYEYQTLYAFETSYWWYQGLHGAILDTFKQLNLPTNARLLDMGCGTGQNAVNLAQHISHNTFAFDFSPHAAALWAQRGLDRACLASINDVPYPNETFDAVISVDVFESDGVDQQRAAHEMWRIVKPGGYLLLIVPAYAWLLTEEHHRAVHASRRYNRTSAQAVLQQNSVRVVRATHIFALLFPPIAAYRLLLQRFSKPSATPRSELKPLPPLINGLLTTIMRVERWLLQRMDMPVGSSILVVAQKANS